MDTQQQKPSKDVNVRNGLQQLDDDTLLEKLQQLLKDDHAIEADLLFHLGEVDHRRLYRERAHSSMFQFCVDELFLSESVAYKRIAVARAARTYPVLVSKVARGELHLTGLCLLAPHLTAENVEELTRAATHKSKRAIEKLLAARYPQPDVPSRVHKLPTRTQKPNSPLGASSETQAPASQNTDSKVSSNEPEASGLPQPTKHAGAVDQKPTSVATPSWAESDPTARRDEVAPLSAERYKIEFTADAQIHAKLREAQELLGPSVSRKDLATLFSKALDLLVSDLKNKKHGVTSRPHRRKKNNAAKQSPTSATSPTGKSRTIPRVVRRAVYERDEGQCVFVGSGGRRCSERSGLEYHHRVAHGLGGPPTMENVELRCRCHNILAAELDFGAEKMAEFRRGHVRERQVGYLTSRGNTLGAGSGSSSRGRRELGNRRWQVE
jgi:5-methylcytosine-specific restriction endonuclease McrA